MSGENSCSDKKSNLLAEKLGKNGKKEKEEIREKTSSGNV